jgi:hypothetical protein
MHTETFGADRSVSQRVLESLVRRIKAEYVAMPGLTLTPWQASRLIGIDTDLCACLLAILVASGFLVRQTPNRFSRADVN